MPRNSVRKYRDNSPRSPFELLEDNQHAIENLLQRLGHLNEERTYLIERANAWLGTASREINTSPSSTTPSSADSE